MRFILLIIILILLAGCASQTTKPIDFEEIIVVYNHTDFAIGYPETWPVTEEENLVSFDGPAYSMFISITKESLYPDQAVDDYYEETKEIFTGAGMRILDETTETMAGQKAHVLEYDFGSIGDLHLIRAFLQKGNYVYEITCASDSNKFEIMREICSQSWAEFKFNP
jgi:hypothetical protein